MRLIYVLTCAPAKDLESGFRCTIKTSFLSLITMRLEDGRGIEGVWPSFFEVRDPEDISKVDVPVTAENLLSER